MYSEIDFSGGYIKIHISNPSNNLFLLENGEKIAVLNKEYYEINVADNSVIEVDGREVEGKCSVKLIDFSDKIDGFYEETINIDSNIVILGRFFVK